ncbi:MAG: hypothetical protein HFG70_07705 [Hungatella sp.]|nr:hypothetical protein [Hungatella sp.]
MIKKKEIEGIPVKMPERKKGGTITVQAAGKVLVLDCFLDGKYIGRYCMDAETNRYQSQNAEADGWAERKLLTLYGYSASGYYSTWFWHEGEVCFDSRQDEETVRGLLDTPGGNRNAFGIIEEHESRYNQDKKERYENRKRERMLDQMRRIPPLPRDIREWIHRVSGGEDYLLRAKGGKGRWFCTACRAEHTEKELEGAGAGLQEDGFITCPSCRKKLKIKAGKRVIRKEVHVILLQNMDEKDSAGRHMDVRITWDKEGRHVELSEGIRLIIHRTYKAHPCEIYYSQRLKNQWEEFAPWSDICWYREPDFERTNQANRKFKEGYLYPEGIREALGGTVFQPWERVFERAAADGIPMDYNMAMVATADKKFIGLCEYLAKGRFRRLLTESTRDISTYWHAYNGPLCKTGETIEDVFGLRDRQKINRLRDLDGGRIALHWMKYSEKEGEKISTEFILWAEENRIDTKITDGLRDILSPEQIMNYIRRQQKESYPGKTGQEVLGQWTDYLDMCKKLQKNLSDLLVCRPRELKRRHDEAVEELRKLRAMEELEHNQELAEHTAQEMRRKYPGAEENLEEVRELLEYEDEAYRILVPKSLADISQEGYTLHHCAGSSERYFERIMRHETYICFLRRTKEPDIPYYTIEVEPGGTIRQHRSFYDEEPGIKEIRSFLKKWQKVIRGRMKEEDRRREKASRRLREANIRELIDKGNTRVLNGLMEDFMEAEDPGEAAEERKEAV